MSSANVTQKEKIGCKDCISGHNFAIISFELKRNLLGTGGSLKNFILLTYLYHNVLTILILIGWISQCLLLMHQEVLTVGINRIIYNG